MWLISFFYILVARTKKSESRVYLLFMLWICLEESGNVRCPQNQRDEICQLTPNIILFINELFHETPNKLSVDVLIEIREMYAVNDSATTKLILNKIGLIGWRPIWKMLHKSRHKEKYYFWEINTDKNFSYLAR